MLASKHVRNVEKLNQAGTKCEGKEIGDRNPETEEFGVKLKPATHFRSPICPELESKSYLWFHGRSQLETEEIVSLNLILEIDFFRCLKSRFGVVAGWSLISISN